MRLDLPPYNDSNRLACRWFGHADLRRRCFDQRNDGTWREEYRCTRCDDVVIPSPKGERVFDPDLGAGGRV